MAGQGLDLDVPDGTGNDDLGSKNSSDSLGRGGGSGSGVSVVKEMGSDSSGSELSC